MRTTRAARRSKHRLSRRCPESGSHLSPVNRPWAQLIFGDVQICRDVQRDVNGVKQLGGDFEGVTLCFSPRMSVPYRARLSPTDYQLSNPVFCPVTLKSSLCDLYVNRCIL